MRVTEKLIYDNFINNINRVDQRISNVNDQLATGRRILSPSSDPIALAKALNIAADIGSLNSYGKNIDTAIGHLNIADNSLQNARDELLKIKNLAISGANGINDQDSYNALSDNVYQDILSLKNIANTSFEGKYIFSGTKSDKPAIASKSQSASFVSSTGTLPAGAQVSISKRFADLYQLEDGTYTLSFDSTNSKISLTDSAGNRISIDKDGRDTSMTDHNDVVKAASVDGSKAINYDTGLGVKLTTSAAPTADFSITFDYKKGGDFLYQGNDKAMQAAIGKGLNLPFTVTGAEAFKPIFQTLGSSNLLTDISTGKAATKNTKLTDLRFGNNLIAAPSTITFSGTDHTGIGINSPSPNGLNTNSTVSDLLKSIENSYGNSIAADFKDGKIVLADKRGGKSQFDFKFTDTDSKMLFGNFQTEKSGSGYDLFRIGSDLQEALKEGNNRLGVVGAASTLSGSSGITATAGGIYNGAIDDKWTFTSYSGGKIPPDISSGLTTTIKVTDKNNNLVATIDFTENSTTIKDKNGNTLSTTSSAYLPGELLNLPNGVDISFSNLGGVLSSGDSFSVNLANKIQSSISLIDKYLPQLESSLSKVGSLTNRAMAQKNRISTITISDKKEKSSLMDVDYTAAISQYKQLQVIMQATLSSMAQINQMNLFNFLK